MQAIVYRFRHNQVISTNGDIHRTFPRQRLITPIRQVVSANGDIHRTFPRQRPTTPETKNKKTQHFCYDFFRTFAKKIIIKQLEK
jgi:hypothetical protein